MSVAHSAVSRFEAAVDAVVAGDVETLAHLLRENPELVRTRSTRPHHSALLHYVSANGVEDSRQKTPPTIVAIATLLLDRGADVNAESEAYGGRSTVLGLTATSCHPAAAGVQLRLLDLFIERGAVVDIAGSDVNACLRNGRAEAAGYLAARGASLDLEGAAGTGHLEIVRNFFDHDGHLKPAVPREQMIGGFAWACEFGRDSVIEFLLERGVNVGAKRKSGDTGLHWAALGGRAATVRILLARGAPVDAVEELYGGTPLGWALHGWRDGQPGERERRRSYYETVALLVRAGSAVDPPWLDAGGSSGTDPDLGPHFDGRMLAALRGNFS